MKRSSGGLCLALIFCGLFGCGDPAELPQQQHAAHEPALEAASDAASTGQEEYILDAEELARLQLAALDGGPEAADRVAMHFAESSIGNQKYKEETKHWFQIAAENGNVSAMVTNARLIYEQGGQHNCRRALFWLNRAERNANNNEVRESVKGWLEKISADCGVHK